ncbi:carbohydrate binding domain protein [Aspergillus steynii IBT 23096]|uniref:Carbohydrate binding domain protein n=1 Tax=Aspergillus steynii IBT 23096 TaxID=1392250 RepID=A0A2I2FW58_9EURO|nr:carbohydrate binding domain protein [Aspergillus steynii IBT 23096]PLB44855.1 carbohydrate binding domain protein [Aspergillus steynii IBT 23096]
MALSCNVLANPSFETGTLSPWVASAVDVAQISTGTPVLDGDYYLNLETAVGNRGNSISQSIKDLTIGANYTFSVKARSPNYGANYCGVFAYHGSNSTAGSIASEQLFDQEEWVEVRGSYRPTTSRDILHVGAYCTFSGSSYTGHILFDDLFLGKQECEVQLD